MWLVQQELVNEHVDYSHKKPIHIVVVFHLSMSVNHHRIVVDVVVDYRDYVPKVKHRK
jgi:hypothetical protein